MGCAAVVGVVVADDVQPASEPGSQRCGACGVMEIASMTKDRGVDKR